MRFAWIEEPPFNYATPTGVTGCDVEVARHVAGALGQPLDLIEAEFAELIPGLAEGRWEMTTGMFITAERAEVGHFTQPIWALPDGLLVRAGSPLGGYRDVARSGGRLAVLEGQEQRNTAIANGVRDDQLAYFEAYAQAAAAVVAGKVDAYASVARAHVAFADTATELQLAAVEVPADEKQAEPGAFACATPGLCAAVDEVLAGYLGSGAHRALVAPFGFDAADIARL